MLLDKCDNLKLADFSGSSIENTGQRALVTYDLRSRLYNRSEPDKASDLFALGSAIYEMTTGHLPYPLLSSKQVRHKLSQKDFPSLKELEQRAPEIAKAIHGCWNVKAPGGFKSAEDVVRILELCYGTRECQTDVLDNVKPRVTKSQTKERSISTTHAVHPPKSRNAEGRKKQAGKKSRRQVKSSKHSWGECVSWLCRVLLFRKR